MLPVVSEPAITSVVASSRSCLLLIAVPVSSSPARSRIEIRSPWSVPAARYRSMMPVSIALSRLRAAANRRLDRVGTQPSPGTLAVMSCVTSSESNTRSSRSISSAASRPMSLDSSVLVSTVRVMERSSRSKASVPPSGHPLIRGTATSRIVSR